MTDVFCSQSDVERLAAFRDVVLYSNLEQELKSDEGLQIDEAHVEAFKACQFSAQYLDHSVASLSERLDLYTEDYRGLHDTRKQLARRKKSLVRSCPNEHFFPIVFT